MADINGQSGFHDAGARAGACRGILCKPELTNGGLVRKCPKRKYSPAKEYLPNLIQVKECSNAIVFTDPNVVPSSP